MPLFDSRKDPLKASRRQNYGDLGRSLRMRFYLAHSMKDRKAVRMWEQAVEDENPQIELFNPFYDTERKDIEEIDAGKIGPYSKSLDYKAIVLNDLREVAASDGLVAIITDSPTAGLYFEMSEAFRLGKPVFILIFDSERRWHPWLRFFSYDQITDDFAVLETWLKEASIAQESLK